MIELGQIKRWHSLGHIAEKVAQFPSRLGQIPPFDQEPDILIDKTVAPTLSGTVSTRAVACSGCLA